MCKPYNKLDPISELLHTLKGGKKGQNHFESLVYQPQIPLSSSAVAAAVTSV